jgi:tetratricopeptide (TPR) repeat protein
MELVKGVPITKYCDDNQLTPRERLELFIPVCQAVQHAHQKGIVHRDLKPSNVLVARYDEKPVPKVIDFGVAKATGPRLTEKTLFTQFGQLVGTLEYMSPEQAMLNALDVDTRSDIYSLGVLLYELLTGSTPLEKNRLKETAFDEVLRTIREEDPPTPSTRLANSRDTLPAIAAQRKIEPAKLARLVRGELDWIVMKALDKDRNRRYENANSLAEDVRRYLADEPVSAGPPTAGYRLWKFTRRHRGALLAAAIVSALLAMLIGGIGWMIRDRAARQVGLVQQLQDAMTAAHALVQENQPALARQRLAEVRALIVSDRAAVADLAEEVEGFEKKLDRWQRFLDFIGRAHEEETRNIEEQAAGFLGVQQRSQRTASYRYNERQPARGVPFLLEALESYGVLDQADWLAALEDGALGKQQVEQLRRSAYEELLWLANDVAERRKDHRTGASLSPDLAARRALDYLQLADKAHLPTHAYYQLRARCYKTLGQEEAARNDKHRAAKSPPTIAYDYYQLGQAAFAGRNKAEAIIAFEAGLRLEPSHFWSLMWLGYCYCDLGREPADYHAAVTAFDGCIMHRPQYAHVYRWRGIAYKNLKRLEEAMADFSKAIELSPKRAAGWYYRGIAYADLLQWDKAITDYSSALNLEPGFVQARVNRGVAYQRSGQAKKALAEYSKVIELDPKFVLAWNNRGNVYQDLGQLEKALTDYTKATELDPQLAFAWSNRGKVYQRLARFDDAIAAHNKAIAMEAKFAAFWSNRGFAYAAQGQWDKALADHSKAIALDPKDPERWFERANLYRRLGRMQESLADMDETVKLEPKSAARYKDRGDAYQLLGRMQDAVADYSRAIELDSTQWEARLNRGRAYCELRQFGKALSDLSTCIRMNPKRAIAYGSRGFVHCQIGQWALAIADFTTAIALEPNLVLLWYHRGFAHAQLRQWAEAIRDWSRASDLEPQNVHVCASLAWLLATCPDAKARDPRRAVELAKKAVELAPKEGDYWNTLGVAKYRSGDWKGTLAALEQSMRLHKEPDCSDWFFAAMAHWQLGHKDEAHKAYERAVTWMTANQPRNDELRSFRAEAAKLLGVKD